MLEQIVFVSNDIHLKGIYKQDEELRMEIIMNTNEYELRMFEKELFKKETIGNCSQTIPLSQIPDHWKFPKISMQNQVYLVQSL